MASEPRKPPRSRPAKGLPQPSGEGRARSEAAGATSTTRRPAGERGATGSISAPEACAELEIWFAEAARDLPWRRRRSGYHALVSELMLQQTQVSRVVEKFALFVRRFPTVQALAEASEDEVLAHWQGLGYYRRARLLHAAAKAIVAEHGGRVPSSPDALLRLPGIGRYTAGAIASIAFGERAPIVDGNVTRVFQRLAAREGSASDREVTDWAWAEAGRFVAAASDPGRANEALMELGATICTPLAPRCSSCPLARRCISLESGATERIPAPKERLARKELVLVTARLERSDGALLLEQRPARGLWARLWQPPTLESADGESLSPPAAAQLLGLGVALQPLATIPFATTHRSVRFVVFTARIRGRGEGLAMEGRRWIPPSRLPEYALSNAAKRVLALGK